MDLVLFDEVILQLQFPAGESMPSELKQYLHADEHICANDSLIGTEETTGNTILDLRHLYYPGTVSATNHT